MIFTNEVENILELKETIKDISIEGEKKVGVIAYIFDDENNLYLNKRGLGARDEVGKLQAFGGSVNIDDKNFREALKRELKEECSSDANIEIESFIGAIVEERIVDNKLVSWILLGYKCRLISGEIKIGEPSRSMGIYKDKVENFLNKEVSSSFIKFSSVLMNK